MILKYISLVDRAWEHCHGKKAKLQFSEVEKAKKGENFENFEKPRRKLLGTSKCYNAALKCRLLCGQSQ